MNSEAVLAMFAMIARGPDLSGAVCADPSTRGLFDRAAESWAAEVRQAAVGVCARCPAQAACRAWVEGLSPSRRPRGVVGGLFIAGRSGWSAKNSGAQ